MLTRCLRIKVRQSKVYCLIQNGATTYALVDHRRRDFALAETRDIDLRCDLFVCITEMA